MKIRKKVLAIYLQYELSALELSKKKSPIQGQITKKNENVDPQFFLFNLSLLSYSNNMPIFMKFNETVSFILPICLYENYRKCL